MDDVITQLQECAEQVPVALDLPTDDDLLNVEEALFLPLPKDYRDFLESVSDLVIGPIEPATAADPLSHTYIPELAANEWANGLPRHLIPICVTPTVTYAIDPDGLILSWAKGKQQSACWESIWDWAQQVWVKSSRK